ncbi:MAG: hypothetical protein DMF32_05090 [Verrucomicrobia bacterium]|jgi:hypothetical protein|nr:MAG: hypothetical protein DMF32_05090 [Verrucomicrobiota bacterium]
MKIYFDDPEYDGQFLRALDDAPLGAQIGEAWAIPAQIRPGDAASWYNAWSSYADRLYGLAFKSNDAGIGSAPATRSCAHRTIIVPRTFSCLRCPLIRG